MVKKTLRQKINDLGSDLVKFSDSKKRLIPLLKKASTCLSRIPTHLRNVESILSNIRPFLNTIVKRECLQHDDQEIKLLVAMCHCEITRICVPDVVYYKNEQYRDIFNLMLIIISDLKNDTDSLYHERRIVIFECLASFRSFDLMLAVECYDLVDKLFTTLLSVISEKNSEEFLRSMHCIIVCILDVDDDVQENPLVALLSVFRQKDGDKNIPAIELAMGVIRLCAAKLEPGIQKLLLSIMSNENKSQELNYYDVIDGLYPITPQLLSGVVPYLITKLVSDQPATRLKAVGLVCNMVACQGSTISKAFPSVLKVLLERLTDRDTEVRKFTLDRVTDILLNKHPTVGASQMITASLCELLSDNNENVRERIVSVVCDVACHDFSSVSHDAIRRVVECVRDKSVLVKTYTVTRLADIYRASCAYWSNCSKKDDGEDWIAEKILKSFYDKDFRSEDIEFTVSLSLFSTDLSVKDKVKNWVRLFSTLDEFAIKALETILQQKQSLRTEMQKYLFLRQSSEGGDGPKNDLFHVMSCCFTDPAKTADNFRSLDKLENANIWKRLVLLLQSDTTTAEAIRSRDELLKLLDQKNSLYEFLSSLSLKCSHLLFDKEFVKEILVEANVQKSSELTRSCMTILVMLARFFPSMLDGTEDCLMRFLENDNEIIKEDIQDLRTSICLRLPIEFFI